VSKREKDRRHAICTLISDASAVTISTRDDAHAIAEQTEEIGDREMQVVGRRPHDMFFIASLRIV